MTGSPTANFMSITGDFDFLPLFGVAVAGVGAAVVAVGAVTGLTTEAAAALRPLDADRAAGFLPLDPDAEADLSALALVFPVFSAALGVGFLFRVDPDRSMVRYT